MSPRTKTEAAWSLTRAISPQDRVRVAAVDASGAILNQYSHTWPTDRALAPAAPWAVPLASAGGFRLLAFDFDAKGTDAAVVEDSQTLSTLLTDAGIEHLICRSGPSGGRHIWVATREAIDPDLIGSTARLAKAILPTLDIAPLRNAATGCVRPPGAPHRDGGTSELLAGDVSCLLEPTTSRAAIERLAQSLAALINGPSPTGSLDASSVRIDVHGHPYLPGARRPLPAASLAALESTAAGLDASTVLNTILLGAAASHWHLSDIAELAPTAPGLEHIRTRRNTRTRTPRPRREQAQTLARQWRYAVQFVADHPRRAGLDATFDARAGELADTVRVQQERADASGGRWLQGGGPSDRRVLDTLHLWALTAVTVTVEADVRRIALSSGIGRETARTALLRLAADGWISQVDAAAGVHGATWNIAPRYVFPSNPEHARSQAATRPEGAGAAERATWIRDLEQRLSLAGHDLFTGAHALPLAAGNLYARLVASPSTTTRDDRLLRLLATFNLLRASRSGWVIAEPTSRDAAAAALGVVGRLDARRERYQAERAAWSWWQAERTWMAAPRSQREHRSRPDQAPLWQPAAGVRYPKHPRGPNGRADFTAARAAVRNGALAPAAVLVAA